jgi:hypothetical protein
LPILPELRGGARRHRVVVGGLTAPTTANRLCYLDPAMKLCFREGPLLVILKIRHSPLRNVGYRWRDEP